MARQFIYNSIPHQTLLHANQLTVRAWNDYINILRIQTNDSSTYIETLNKWLFSESSVEENFYDDGFVPYIISSLNSLKGSKLDTSVFDSTIQSIRAELSTKATTTYIEGLLALKADVSSVIALQQDKADTTYVNEVARDINQKITQLTNTKADKTYVDTELLKKASTSTVDSVTARVSNLESKDTQHDERLLNLENTKLNSSDFNSYKSITDNAITLKLEKNLSNIGTLESGIGDSYTVVINDGVNSYKVTIAELKEIFGSLDTEQQLNHYKGIYKKLIDVPAGLEGDYCFIEKIENGDSILTMYVWNKTDNIWEETNTSQYITSTVFSNFKQSIETGSTSVGLARDYTPNDGIGRKFTELETNKQDKLTFDEEPIEGSTNPVTSGGLFEILKDGVGGIIDVDKLPQLTGTLLVSNPETMVEKVIFNDSLSVEETVGILSQLTYVEFNGLNVVPLFSNAYGTNTIYVLKNGPYYAIAHTTNIMSDQLNVIFLSEDTADTSGNYFNAGWVKNEFTINDTGVSDLMGLPIGTENEKLITLLSMNNEFSIDVDDKSIYRLRKDVVLEYKGTTVPNSGAIESFYFNTSLTQDEVQNILNNLSWIDASNLGQSGFEFYPVLAYMQGSYPYVLAFKKYTEASGSHSIGDINGAIINFANMATIQDFYIFASGGWQTFTNPYPINSTLLSQLSGISIGAQNDKLSSFISTTPFEEQYGNKYTYWVYKDKWAQLLTDEIKNEDEYIVIEKKGDFISQPESISFSSTEFDIIQSNNKVLVKITLDGALRVIFYKNVNDEDSYTDQIYFSANFVYCTYHLVIMRNKTTKEVTTRIAITDLINDSRVEGFSVTEQGNEPVLMLHVRDKIGDSIYYSIPLKTEIEKDSIDIPTTGAVYKALDKKLTKSLSDVSSTTNVATTDNMLLNKAGTMYKVTIQELQEVFGSANYKGNFVSASALPATGTAGDYAFVKAVTDGDTDLIMYIWNDTDKHWEETGTSQYVKNATFQATMETKQDKLDVSLDEKGTMNIVIPESIEGAKTIKVNGVELVPVMEDITWENLKTLRDEGKLIPGKSYKIIDYTCTTSQSRTISAHHDFDIIVTADSPNTLNENARACLKDGDTYFRTVDPNSNKIDATNCKFIDETIIDDDTIRLNVLGYQYIDTNQYPADELQNVGDIFLYATYATNPDGFISPVIYNTGRIEEGTDFSQPYFYYGTWELDDVVYDIWRKHEDLGEGKVFTWNTPSAKLVITDKLVQGKIVFSEPSALEICNLSAWELKYCLDNDITRFAWADTTNGKGVIYYMKDEHGNEAWYDFKSIKQKVDDKDFMPTTSLWCRTPLDHNYEGDEYFYTFHLEGGTDLSVKALIGPAYNANIELWHPKNNKINPFRTRLSIDGEKQTEVLWLPHVIFYTNTLFIDKYYGLFLWENSRVTGSEVLCVGTLWNVELEGTNDNGLCGCFVNTCLHVNHYKYFEGTIRGGCTINVFSLGITFYKIWNNSRVEGTLCYLQDDPGIVYQYTTNFENPEPLYEEAYEEEEE